MPRPDDAPPLTRGVVLRGAGFAVAVALGAVAVWLIVTSTTQKRVELGVLAGLWAAMIGAFSMFGTRRIMHPLESDYAAVAAAAVAAAAGPGSEIELRSARAELERTEEAAARRAHEVRLEGLLRREIQTTVGREVSALRSEISELRGELLEKVGGQLRLERTETTRVIGSNLEALQEEMRRLKFAADTGEFDVRSGRARTSETGPVRQIVEPARVRPVSRQTADVEADVQPARSRPPAAVRYDTLDVSRFDAPAPAPAAAAAPAGTAPASTAPAGTTSSPDWSATTSVTAGSSPPSSATPASPPAPAASAPAPAEPATSAPATPAPATSAPATSSAAASPAPAPTPFVPPAAVPASESRPQPPAPPPTSPLDDFPALPRLRPFTDFELDPIEDDSYTGRRRRLEDPAANGKHASPVADQTTRRHRRSAEDDAADDLLARLLARRSQEL